jgi:hypothetical protein
MSGARQQLESHLLEKSDELIDIPDDQFDVVDPANHDSLPLMIIGKLDVPPGPSSVMTLSLRRLTDGTGGRQHFLPGRCASYDGSQHLCLLCRQAA